MHKKAFSLIELLISLIIISLIAASFTPVLTRIIKHNRVSIASKESLKTDCKHIDEEGFCKLCSKDKCVTCARSCEEGFYLEYLSCKCKKCPQYGEELIGEQKACKVKDPCLEHNAVFVQNKDKTIKFCMKKRNIGDAGGPSIAGITGQARCWRAPSSGCTADAANNSGFTYSGCSRTVCNFYAAQQACAAIGWSLPTESQLKVLIEIINSETIAAKDTNIQRYNPNGLQLCSYETNANSPRCDSTTYSCAPSDSMDWCDPSDVYSSSALCIRYSNGSLAYSSSNPENASSVRCVLTLN